MSRLSKWKLEKTKVKVVFRLQFHATHIPQQGWDKLFVFFISADSGKVIAKTTKANVKNGNCKWSDPIYETTRLLQDAKTKQYDEKLYKLVVAMGSSRSSLLGGATINLADYADASKPSSVALLLQGSNFGTVLHVTIQLLTSKIGFREFEQQRALTEKGLQTMNGQSVQVKFTEKMSASVEPADDHNEKVNTRARFVSDSTDLPSIEEEEEGEFNEDCMDSAFGIDGPTQTSESLYAEKHDISSIHNVDGIKSTISDEVRGLPLSQNHPSGKEDQCYPHLWVQENNDWVNRWSSDCSIDNDLTSTYDENIRHNGSLEVAQSAVVELKVEVIALQSYADKLGAETQKFTQQLDAEIALGEELTREVSLLKSECSKFKDDLKQLKHVRDQHFPSVETEFLNNGSRTATTCTKAGPYFFDGKFDVSTRSDGKDFLFHDLQKYLEGFLVMENKIRDIQNKACVRYDERDINLLLPDLDDLKYVLHDLKQSMTQLNFLLNVHPAERRELKEIALTALQETAPAVNVPQNADANCYSSNSNSMSQELQSEGNNMDATAMMRENCFQLLTELEASIAERENLTRKMNQMECYYEALIQELEEGQKQMLDEMSNLRSEHSTCLFTISSFKRQLEMMHEDMNEQFLRFAEDRQHLESLNKELEKRAVISETTLKRLQWSYAIAVDQLQKELELLSLQVLSMFETNEILVKQTFAETSGFCPQEYVTDACRKADQKSSPKCKSSSVMLDGQVKQNADDVMESRDISLEEIPLCAETLCRDDSYTHRGGQVHATFEDILKEGNTCINDSNAEVLDLQIPSRRIAHEMKDSLLLADVAEEVEEDLKKMERLLQLQTVLQQKAEAEFSEVYEQNLRLDVFSNALCETLNEKNDVISLLEKKTDELMQQLGNFSEYEEKLMLKLRMALDDTEVLKISEANLTTLCNDLTLRNQSLIGKLQDISNKNYLLSEKVAECERLNMEYRFYKSKYEACTAEKTGLENLLKKESLERSHLQSEFGFVIEEFKTLKEEFAKQSSLKDNLEKTVTSLQDKFGDLRSCVISHNEQITGVEVTDETEQQILEDNNFTFAFLHLEELPQKVYERILQLCQEKKDIEKQRDIAQSSLGNMESQFLSMQQKFEPEAQNMMAKLDTANAHVEKLQIELQNFENKLKISSVTEEKYAATNRELLSKLSELEMELQLVSAENKDLSQKTATFNSVARELEESKLAFADCMRENKMLSTSLQAANEESVQLVNDLGRVKESLRCVCDELQHERGLRNKLAASVVDLTSQLNERQEQLLAFDDHKTELVELRQQVSVMELEKSQVKHLLFQSEQCQRKMDEDALFLRLQVADLETQLSEMQEYLLAADTEVIFIKSQFMVSMKDLLGRLKSLEGCNGELQFKYLDMVTTLKGHMAREEHYVEENERLMTALQSLRCECNSILSQKEKLEDYVHKNTALWSELENHKTREAMVEVDDSQEQCGHEIEMEQLRSMLVNSEEEIYNLHFSKNELEVKVIVLRSKLDECCAQMSLLKEYDDELRKLRKQHNELTRKLSEQILKTEEFRNLSIHLKELQGKAAAMSYQDCDKKEKAPPAKMQESLRMVFIREQYESKLQELRSQLYVSKNHGEEMLMKLQDALDETENRKRKEASHVKKNEELCFKILELENDLQLVLAEKRERVNAYDRMKAELECSVLNLDCCREENFGLKASLQECDEQNKKLADEVNLLKELLEVSKPSTLIQDQEFHGPGVLHSLSIKPPSEGDNSRVTQSQEAASDTKVCFLEEDRVGMISNKEKMDTLKLSKKTGFLSSYEEVKDELQVSIDEGKNSSSPVKLLSPQDGLAVVLQDGLLSGSALGIPRQIHLEKEGPLWTNMKHVAPNKDHLKEQILKFNMDCLQKGLELMKVSSSSSQFPCNDHHSDPTLQGLRRELSQLHMANERLRSIFPLFSEISGDGNALERVLALEIELAEALRAKKSTIHFQSSFLKQHNNEEAIFRSFGDINELVTDTQEVKRRYVAVENELKEMHERYSQLSLQFAEVEEERQKLIMALKNAKPTKKT